MICPEDRRAKSDDVFTCDVTDNGGAKHTVNVTQKDNVGNIEWKLVGLIIDTDKIISEAKQKLPADTVITCPHKMIVLSSGETAKCAAKRGAEQATFGSHWTERQRRGR